MSAATAVPTKAREATPRITNFNIESSKYASGRLESPKETKNNLTPATTAMSGLEGWRGPTAVFCGTLRKWYEFWVTAGGALMHHYASQLVDLLLVLVGAWTVLAIIFFIYAYFAGLKYPVSESVFGRLIVISFFIITMSIWLPIVVGALILSLIGYLWSRFRE
jgi:hypothetical protein